jgi:hypothetical protein
MLFWFVTYMLDMERRSQHSARLSTLKARSKVSSFPRSLCCQRKPALEMRERLPSHSNLACQQSPVAERALMPGMPRTQSSLRRSVRRLATLVGRFLRKSPSGFRRRKSYSFGNSGRGQGSHGQGYMGWIHRPRLLTPGRWYHSRSQPPLDRSRQR